METDARAILIALAKPFTADEIDWRVGSTTKTKEKGQALAYIDARAVMDRFDAVMGVNWKCEYPTIQRLAAGMGEEDGDEQGRRKKPRSKSLVVCRISLRFGDEWIWREDGAGDSAVEAEKGALSDALKRAAVRWGVGRFLYAMPNPWVKLDQFKAIDRDELPRLRRIAEEALAAYERNPAHRAAPAVAPQDAARAPAPPPAPLPAAVEAPRPVRPPVAPAPLAVSIARLAEAAGTGGDSVDALTLAFGVERQKLPPEQWEPLELAYVEQVVKVLERLEGPSAARDIERVVGFLGTAQLSRDGAPRKRARAAVAAARARCT